MVVRDESTSQKEWPDGRFSALKGAFPELDGDGQTCRSLRCGQAGGMLCTRWGPRDLDHGSQVFDTALAHELIEAGDCILLEMGRSAVRVERFAVFVLLVDEDCIGIVFDPMGNVGDAARFLTGCRGQFFENFGDLLAVFVSKAHAYSEANHNSVLKLESTIKLVVREV